MKTKLNDEITLSFEFKHYN